VKTELLEKLKQHGQEHLLRFWDDLSVAQQESLNSQIQQIDFEQIRTLYEIAASDDKWQELAAAAEVPTAITLDDFANADSYEKARATGLKALSEGKVAMILVAGGQGSRLGFDHPKGMFPIGPISKRTLYQMMIEQVMARSMECHAKIPLYIMTSPPTHEETSEFLKSNRYFGFNSEDLKIFCQGVMPAVDQDGKLLLENKGSIFASPDGHGGTLRALEVNGCLADMKARGVEHLFYAQIDNPLVQVCNPALLGYHIESKSEMTSQVVRKNEPLQKVGNVVEVDGRVQIIEYSDLPEEFAKQTNADGSLKLWAGSIAVHIFKSDFLYGSARQADSLPFHRAHKKVAFVDADGKQVEPEQANAVKFEKFIFDLLPGAKNAIVCEVNAADGFCAVKNSPPAPSETPDHVKAAIVDLHKRWLTEAGAAVVDGVKVEISPLFATDAESLKEKIASGIKIESDTYFV
jgi:UDP-N-acetylglucosamine/UDP-N-acetylgalactosamine diphosphorylase